MAKMEMIKPYVEKIVKEYLEVENLVVDDDGDIPIRRGSTMYYVRVLDMDPPLVRLFSPILREVKKSAKLFEQLNTINNEIMGARVFFNDGTVVVATELLAETLDAGEIATHCNNIGAVADDWDTKLQADFGGEVLFTDGPEEGKESVEV